MLYVSECVRAAALDARELRWRLFSPTMCAAFGGQVLFRRNLCSVRPFSSSTSCLLPMNVNFTRARWIWLVLDRLMVSSVCDRCQASYSRRMHTLPFAKALARADQHQHSELGNVLALE